MHQRRRCESGAQRRQEVAFEPAGRAGGQGGDTALRDRHPEQIRDGLRDAFLRPELRDQQIHHDRGQPRPVLHRRIHPGRRGRTCHRRTRATTSDQLMLGDPGSDLRNLEHLTAGHGRDRRVGESVATSATRHRFMSNGLVRIIDLPQRATGVTVLATRTAPGPTPQRLRRRLVQALSRGRHVRVARCLTQPAPQLGVLRFQDLDPRITRRDSLLQRNDRRLQRHEPLQQLHDGRHVGHPDILPNKPQQDQAISQQRPE
jgi:hypothetical protein